MFWPNLSDFCIAILMGRLPFVLFKRFPILVAQESEIKRQMGKYRSFSKEVKRNIHKAKWNHVNNVIKDNLEQNTTKPLVSLIP